MPPMPAKSEPKVSTSPLPPVAGPLRLAGRGGGGLVRQLSGASLAQLDVLGPPVVLVAHEPLAGLATALLGGVAHDARAPAGRGADLCDDALIRSPPP